MTDKLRYQGQFYSRDNHRYRFEIWDSSGKDFETQEVLLAADAIEIVWDEVDKLEPVHGSSATVSLLSMSDREFLDMYSVKYGAIRLLIFRDDQAAPYWVGTLEPEVFEEPYSYKDRYITTLTFVDFAILDRISWEGKEFYSILEVVRRAINSARLSTTEGDPALDLRISTCLDLNHGPLSLSEVYVLGENFYDEDGEAMNLREVLEECLRPFALCMVQKNGFHLFDLNAISGDQPLEVQWAGNDAYIEADKVYNNVNVTFSPYGKDSFFDGTLSHDEVLPDAEGGAYYRVGDGSSDSISVVGFILHNGAQDDLPLKLMNGAQFFRIDSVYSGSDEAGVIWARVDPMVGSPNILINKSFPRVEPDATSVEYIPKPIIKCPSAFCSMSSKPIEQNPSRPEWIIHRENLRISLEVLFDVRYNPFEQASGENSGDWGALQDWCNFGYIPAMLYLKDKSGNILYHYENRDTVMGSSYLEPMNPWVAGSGKWGDMWLSYYNYSDRKSASGFGGWATNKRTIGYYRDALPGSWQKTEDGLYAPFPPEKGYLELQIGSGIYQFDYKREVKDIYSKARWLMYKNPKIEILDGNLRKALENEDVVDSAWINRAAEESLDISTILGTPPKNMPTARGLIFDGNGSLIPNFYRAGVTDRIERLLIGTVYSQYANRNHLLSGTVKLLTDFSVCTDRSEPGSYVVVGETQRLAADESEIRMVRFSPDNYEGIEYK